MEQRLVIALMAQNATRVKGSNVMYSSRAICEILNLAHGERLIGLFVDAQSKTRDGKYLTRDGIRQCVRGAQTMPLKYCAFGDVARFFDRPY